LASAVFAVSMVSAQGLPASPDGKAQAQVGGQYVKNARGGQTYQNGKWLEIAYGRPLLRGRTNIFGSGATYGQTVLAGAPVWRAGANVTTRLRTEAPLVVGGKTVPAGEYSVFIELKEGAWTFILSSWPAQQKYDANNKEALWGGYNYTADRDVARAPMRLMKSSVSVEQLTWGFINVTDKGGELALWWDTAFAVVPFGPFHPTLDAHGEGAH
jgi:hypothetical protein